MHFARKAFLALSIFFYALLWAEASKCVILKKGTDNGEAVEAHNYYRRLLNKGKVAGQPKAKYIPQLKWDSYLAKEAMKVAATCEFEHRYVSSSRWSFVGQNLYIWGTNGKYKSWINWKGVVKSWFDENRLYTYRPFSRKGYKKIGHYTQVVWQKTTRVGCGYAIFRKSKGWISKLIVCHYGPGGNTFGQVPYQRA